MNITTSESSSTEWLKDLKHFNHSIFHHPGWLEAIKSETNTPFFLNFSAMDHTTVGKLSGFIEQTGRLRGQQLYAYSGIALNTDNPNIVTNSYRALYQYARENNLSRIILGSYGQPVPVKLSVKHYYPFHRLEYVIDLQTKNPENSFHYQIKRHLKKASGVNPVFIEGDETMLPLLHDMLAKVHDQRVKRFKKNYDSFYLRHLDERALTKLLNSGVGKIYALKSSDGISAMEFNLEIDREVYMLLKATNEFGYRHGLSSHLTYRLIQHYRDQNFTNYNLGGRPPGKEGDGLSLYKERLGTTIRKLQGVTTNFVTYPLRLTNPLLKVARRLPENGLVNRIKGMM